MCISCVASYACHHVSAHLSPLPPPRSFTLTLLTHPSPPQPSLSSPGLSSNAWPFSSLPVDPNPVLLLSVHAPAMRTLSVPAMPLRQAPGAVTEAVTGAATGAEAAPQIEEESLQSVASEGREGLEEGGSDGAEDSDGVDEGEGAGSGMAEEGVGEENGDKGNVDVTVRVPREDEGEEVGRERQQLGVRRGWSEGEHHKAHTWGRLSRRRSSLPVRRGPASQQGAGMCCSCAGLAPHAACASLHFTSLTPAPNHFPAL